MQLFKSIQLWMVLYHVYRRAMNYTGIMSVMLSSLHDQLGFKDEGSGSRSRFGF